MKKGIKILTYIVGGFIILFTLASSILLINKQKIIDVLSKQLDKSLKTEIYVKDIQTSLLRNFPNATIIFEEILIRSVPEFNPLDFNFNTDTLLVAKKASFTIDLIDILKKKYTFNSITVSNGSGYLLTDKNGNSNYNLLVKNQQKSALELSITKARLHNINLTIVNQKTETRHKINTSKSTFSLNTKKDARRYSFESQLSIINSSLINNQDIEEVPVKLSAYISQHADTFLINKGTIDVSALSGSFKGAFIRFPNYTDSWIEISGKDFQTRKASSLINSFARKTINASAQLDYKIIIKGPFATGRYPEIEGTFHVISGEFPIRNEKLIVNDLKGNFKPVNLKNLRNIQIEIDQLDVTYLESNFKGSYSISGINYPLHSVNIHGNISSRLLNNLTGDQMSFESELPLQITLNAKGRTASLNKLAVSDLSNFNYQGQIIFKDLQVASTNEQYKLTNGEIKLNNDIEIVSLDFQSDFIEGSFTGKLNNILRQAGIENKSITVEGTTKLVSVNLDEFKKIKYEKNSSKKYNISIQTAFSIQIFKYNKLSLSNIAGYLVYRDRELFLRDLKADAFGGNIEGSCAYIVSEKPSLSVDISTHRIDITQLFYTFDNFKQTVIKSDNISGKLSGNILYKSSLTSENIPDFSTMRSTADIEIFDGELKQVDLLQKLSNFIDVEELSHVKFSTLKNVISITNKVVIIPQMHINSSVLELDVSGNHAFSGEYNYIIIVSLSDLLRKKSSSATQTEFGEIYDSHKNRWKIPLIVEGNNETNDIRYSRKTAKELRKDKIEDEKGTLQEILRQEFNNDIDQLDKNQTENDDHTPKVIWEEENIEKETTEKKKKVEKQKEDEIQINWEDN